MSVDVLQEKIRKTKNPSVLDLNLSMADLPAQFEKTGEGYGAFCRYRGTEYTRGGYNLHTAVFRRYEKGKSVFVGGGLGCHRADRRGSNDIRLGGCAPHSSAAARLCRRRYGVCRARLYFSTRKKWGSFRKICVFVVFFDRIYTHDVT